MGIWAHAAPSILASFLASLVEFVEALTIVLAVGTVRGWRPGEDLSLFGLAGGFLAAAMIGVFSAKSITTPREANSRISTVGG